MEEIRYLTAIETSEIVYESSIKENTWIFDPRFACLLKNREYRS